MLCDEAPFPTRSGAPSPHESSLVSVERCPNSQEDWMSSASYVMRAIASEEPEPEPESLPSENLPVTNGMLRDLDEVTIRKHSCKANHGKKRVISLENGERFRPRRANSCIVSSEPVHIFYLQANSVQRLRRRIYRKALHLETSTRITADFRITAFLIEVPEPIIPRHYLTQFQSSYNPIIKSWRSSGYHWKCFQRIP
jgi:hypothetical protein